MTNFSSDFLQELRDRLRLSDYVGRRVQLRRNGAESSGLCPFHNEKSPSFTVSDVKGFYHCFGCGAHGSVIDWIMETEGLPFPDAVRRLATDAGLSLPAETPENRAATAKRQTLREVLEGACTWYEAQLAAPEGKAARAYLESRGLDVDTIASFRLGYAPDGRGRLRSALRAKGATDDQLVDAGLMKRPDDGGPLRDYFFDRVMFPITDDRGRVVGFGGRTMGDSAAKYLNSPDNDVFHKGALLYNHHRARDAARHAGSVIAVEGYMDVIALAKAGIAHVVAPLGTALGERQLELMWRMAAVPALCFDGDAAGARAALRAADRALPLLKPGRSLSIVDLPRGEDPDSLLRSAGRLGFVQALQQRARPLVEVVWERVRHANRLDTPEALAAWRADIQQISSRIGDPTVRRSYQQLLQDRLSQELRKRDKTRSKPSQSIRSHVRPLKASEQAVRVLLATLINHPEIGEEVFEALSSLRIEDRSMDLLRDAVLELLAEPDVAGHSPIDRSSIDSHLRSRKFGPVLDQLMSRSTYVHARFAMENAMAEEALRGWFTCFRTLEEPELRSELREATKAFGEDPTDDKWQIVEAHRQELVANSRAVVDDAPPPLAAAQTQDGGGD